MAYGFLGDYPGYLPVFTMRERMEADFLKLPEETQQALLRRGSDSEEELRQQMDELSLRE